MGEVADAVSDRHADELSAALAWVGALAYTAQIYFDFSAYSDMAIGLGKRSGFRFAGKLRLSVYFKVSDGILEKMAYFTFHLVPRLHIHSSGRKLLLRKAPDFQHVCGVGMYGNVARRSLEFHRLGYVVLRAPGWRKIPLGEKDCSRTPAPRRHSVR